MKKLISIVVALFMLAGAVAYPMAATTQTSKTSVVQKKTTTSLVKSPVKKKLTKAQLIALKKKLAKLKAAKLKAAKLKAAKLAAAKAKADAIANSSPKPSSIPNSNWSPMPPLTPNPAATPIPGWTPPSVPGYDFVIPLQVLPTENVLLVGQVGMVKLINTPNSKWRLVDQNQPSLTLDSSITLTDPETKNQETSWFFMANSDGYAKLLFINDSPMMGGPIKPAPDASGVINSVMPAMPVQMQLVYYVRVGNPPEATVLPTPPPKPTPTPSLPPLPTPPAELKALFPNIENILNVGQTGVVKMPYPLPLTSPQPLGTDTITTSSTLLPDPNLNGFIWNYVIGDTSIIDISTDAPYAMTWPQTVWFFKALKAGSTTITFTATPINTLNTLIKMPGPIVFKVTVIDGGIIISPRPTEPPKPTVAPKPTEPPKPTAPPKPTEPPKPTVTPTPYPFPTPPFKDIILNAQVQNYLFIGQVGEVMLGTEPVVQPTPLPTSDPNAVKPSIAIAPSPSNGYVWTYKIGDTTILDIANDRAIPMIWPQTIWFFKGHKAGSTDITFTGNPSNPLMGMPSKLLVFKVTVLDSTLINTPK